MDHDHFWLTEAQFAGLRRFLPTDTRGVSRVDDRRVISGIVHVLKSGGRWADAPRIWTRPGIQSILGTMWDTGVSHGVARTERPS